MKIITCFYNLLLIVSITMGCASQDVPIATIASLPDVLHENSGIEKITTDGLYWMVNDSGNKSKIYGVDLHGKIIRSIKIENAKNHDWEDLTSDNEGHLYIGDFGNNTNDRKNLKVLKIKNPDAIEGHETTATKISFVYPEQVAFPPKKKQRWYDAEAFFHYEKSLYIITKNRSSEFDGSAFIYQIPDTEGHHIAKRIATIVTCDDMKTCQITGAAINSNGKLVLLGHNQLWVSEDFLSDPNDIKLVAIPLGHHSQKEAVCFKNDNQLIIADEKSDKKGQKLYETTLK